MKSFNLFGRDREDESTGRSTITKEQHPELVGFRPFGGLFDRRMAFATRDGEHCDLELTVQEQLD
jgi:hypothetical protein